jgi:hypothetical protein
MPFNSLFRTEVKYCGLCSKPETFILVSSKGPWVCQVCGFPLQHKEPDGSSTKKSS